MESHLPVHIFLVSFPGHGHANPLLRLGKRLASKGLLVTFSTTTSFGKQMLAAGAHLPDQLSFELFDDGWDVEDPRRDDIDSYMAQLELAGKASLPRMLKKHADSGLPVSCLINNPFIPWVSDVADELGIPSAMLWVQSCASFASYYHYHHGLVPFPSEAAPEIDVQLPYTPLLKHDEIPSFLHPSTPYAVLRRAILGQFKNMSKPFCVLMDTFQELEADTIRHMSRFTPVVAVGPLFKNPQAPDADADDCVDWLDSKPASSVVYISFGTVVHLKQAQVDEIARGLLGSGLAFLWVVKPPKSPRFAAHVLPESLLETVGERGKVVQWAPQERVLAHPAVACFVTHCGWNSTVEALASGVPVVAFPQWGDQVTDAKFLVDVFGVGVRMGRGDAEDRLVPREEVRRCLLEATAGPTAAEIKRNVLRWKKAAEEAVAEGGSSDRNLQAFVDEVRRTSAAVACKSADAAPVEMPIRSVVASSSA